MTNAQLNPNDQAAAAEPYQSCDAVTAEGSAVPDAAAASDPAPVQGAYDPYQAQQPYGHGAQPQQPYGASQAQQPYQASYEQPAVSYQQVYAQPVAPAAPATLYPMTDTDRNLRLVAFIFCILSLVGSCWLIIPLAWMIPMSVISWGIYKGTKANTVAFGVCTLIFCSLVAGILLLCSNKDR